LSEPIELLDAEAIRGQLAPVNTAELEQLIVRRSVDSTNTLLAGYRDGATRACLAEYQTAGRGRAGRAWVSPFATNLHLSVGRTLKVAPAALPAINLAVGVALAETLTSFGVAEVGVKWPNDLWIGTAKVAGILAETHRMTAAQIRFVIGVGLNIGMPRSAGATIGQPWTRLIDHVPEPLLRNHVAGRCLNAMLAALREFERAGFAAFAQRWAQYDRLAGRRVDLLTPEGRRTGVARGVAPDGGLRVAIEGRCEIVYAGDVSLRVSRG
jgi:BirA family biotin operon repressor/biotin-[acetyl-CoA-carboxylase] ligase